MTYDVLSAYYVRWKTVQYTIYAVTSLRLESLASWKRLTSTMLVEVVRRGLVTCHDLIFTNKCKLSKDKLITSYGLGVYEMGIYKW